MIVNSVESGWEVIFQASHALLAGQLADHFDHEHRSVFWPITKAAICQHDQQERFEPDTNKYITSVGAPRDFTHVSLTAEERFEKTSQRLQDAYRTSRWMGLLQSTHAAFLYEGEEVAEAMRQLLADEHDRRPRILQQLGMKQSDLQRAYDIVRWCDRCSLILCQNTIPAQQRRLEIITTAAGARYDIWSREDESLVVEPWPFVDSAFHVGVEVFELAKLAFENDVELGAALDDCTPTFRRWMFKKT